MLLYLTKIVLKSIKRQKKYILFKKFLKKQVYQQKKDYRLVKGFLLNTFKNNLIIIDPRNL